MKPLAKITDRFLAYLIDTLPFGVGYHASSIYLILLAQKLPNTAASWTQLAGAWIALYVLYHAVGAAAGATIGKWLMGLEVVGLDGGRLGFGRGLLRGVGMLASTPANLGFLWSFVNKDSRTWHDLLAGSLVVESRPKTAGESLVTALASFATLAGLLGLSVWAHLMRPSPEDQAAIARAREGLQVLAMIQERYRESNGTYSKSLAELAVASGDAAQFKSAMADLFDPKQFRIAASETRFVISARAKDRRRTVVTLSGPPEE